MHDTAQPQVATVQAVRHPVDIGWAIELRIPFPEGAVRLWRNLQHGWTDKPELAWAIDDERNAQVLANANATSLRAHARIWGT